MAAEGVIEIFEDVGEAVGDEVEEAGEAGLDEAEIEEVEAEAAEVKENVSTLRKVATYLKDLATPENLRTFIKFVVKNAAAAAIFYGVTVALKKLFSKTPSDQAAKTKYTKINALANLIKELSQISKTVTTWMKDHQDDKITLDGIQVPLIDIFTKYTTAIGEAVDSALSVAKDLITKKDGKKGFSIPTTGQVVTVLTASDAFITAFSGLVTFADEKKAKFPDLHSFPVSQIDVDDLRTKYYALKALPYE